MYNHAAQTRGMFFLVRQWAFSPYTAPEEIVFFGTGTQIFRVTDIEKTKKQGYNKLS